MSGLPESGHGWTLLANPVELLDGLQSAHAPLRNF
jgi:hypothetical protein